MKSSSSVSVTYSDNSSESGKTSVSTYNDRQSNRCAPNRKQVHPNEIISNKTQPDNRDDKTQPDNRDNKKETQLPDATTVQDRPMKNKCVIGYSNMRGLATQLKSKLTNPESVYIQNFGYENISLNYPTTRICK